jgi:hypothetical protein
MQRASSRLLNAAIRPYPCAHHEQLEPARKTLELRGVACGAQPGAVQSSAGPPLESFGRGVRLDAGGLAESADLRPSPRGSKTSRKTSCSGLAGCRGFTIQMECGVTIARMMTVG